MVFAVSTNTAHPDIKPTLPELIKFTCTDRRVLNIPVEIGTKYVSFGAFLLNDRSQLEFEFECIESHSKGSNLHSNASIRILLEWLQFASNLQLLLA